jgi:hypothetical protein
MPNVIGDRIKRLQTKSIICWLIVAAAVITVRGELATIVIATLTLVSSVILVLVVASVSAAACYAVLHWERLVAAATKRGQDVVYRLKFPAETRSNCGR